MVCIGILMVIYGLSYRKMQNEVPYLNLPWNEPYPDHTWIAKSFKRIPLQYLETILQKVAMMCIKESGWRSGILGTDSAVIETDVYDKKIKPVKRKSGKRF